MISSQIFGHQHICIGYHSKVFTRALHLNHQTPGVEPVALLDVSQRQIVHVRFHGVKGFLGIHIR